MRSSPSVLLRLNGEFHRRSPPLSDPAPDCSLERGPTLNSSNGNLLVVALVEHYETLIGRLRRRFGDHEAAQDVVHDICVRLLSVPPVRGVRSPEAFLRRMTADLAIDRHRVASGRSRLLTEASSDPSLPELCGGPEAAIEHDQMLDAIFRVVDRLPARCRDVFVLHKLHGVPQEEIATRLGISRNMVARHMMRARQDLQVLLDQDDLPVPL